jgi:hypothetical protein
MQGYIVTLWLRYTKLILLTSPIFYLLWDSVSDSANSVKSGHVCKQCAARSRFSYEVEHLRFWDFTWNREDCEYPLDIGGLPLPPCAGRSWLSKPRWRILRPTHFAFYRFSSGFGRGRLGFSALASFCAAPPFLFQA